VRLKPHIQGRVKGEAKALKGCAALAAPANEMYATILYNIM